MTIGTGAIGLRPISMVPDKPTSNAVNSYSDYFLNTAPSIIQYETLEISHPSFTQTFYIVRNNTAGLTAYLEDHTQVTFTYYPIRVTPAQTKRDLDQVFSFEIGDLGELLPTQIDAIAAAGTFNTKPTVKYRLYRSDILTQVMYGPVELQVTAFACNREGAVFEAKAQSLNMNRTGQVYTLDRFPMLRGFL